MLAAVMRVPVDALATVEALVKRMYWATRLTPESLYTRIAVTSVDKGSVLEC
jgi:hypothetical protein